MWQCTNCGIYWWGAPPEKRCPCCHHQFSESRIAIGLLPGFGVVWSDMPSWEVWRTMRQPKFIQTLAPEKATDFHRVTYLPELRYDFTKRNSRKGGWFS
jgi:hypothetical protein